jgi:hypothetical protein
MQVILARRQVRLALQNLGQIGCGGWIDYALFVVIIHAMPMTDEMKRHYRKKAEPYS